LHEANAELRERQEEIIQQNEEILQQADEVILQRDSLSEQNLKISQQHQLIKSSVNYALKIQEAILPSENVLKNYFEYFLIYKPKDIISGDFYWISDVKKMNALNNTKQIMIVLADCTGHGVPGAFMSIIGYSIINEIVNEKEVYDPSLILEEIHKKLIEVLHQTETYNTDGMDLSICLLEYQNNEKINLTFAGANTSIYINRKVTNELTRLRGDHRSVGGTQLFRKTDIFVNKEEVLDKNDIVYFATDGFIDQNNNKRIRFGTSKFVESLKSASYLDLSKQKEFLENILIDWQSNEEQRDDITLLGIKI